MFNRSTYRLRIAKQILATRRTTFDEYSLPKETKKR